MSRHLALRLGLLAACSLSLCYGVVAGDDAREPYKVRIVVDVAKHRLLTDVFKQQLQRELKDGVQAALGKLAKVEVSDSHDLLPAIRADGLQKALDGYRKATGEKVLFVLVDFDGTRYQIQTRQYDGDLQVPSPTVRRERTRDRAYVARVAALLMNQDVGLTGTIVSEPDAGKRVKVDWRGGGLGVDLSRWLKKGEVLCVANPRPGSGEPTLAWTLLQIETPAKDGSSTCVLFSRYRMQRATGLRCMLMGTRSGPLRLRLLEQKRGGGLKELEQSVTLEFRHHGFDGEETTKQEITGGANGDVIDTAEKDKTRGHFDRIAFVTVKAGGDTVKARIPIPLIDDRQITVPIPAEDEATNETLERYRSLARNSLSAAQVLADLFTEVNALTKDPGKLAEALARVRQALQRSKDDYERLSAERAEVAKEVKNLEEKSRPSFQAIDARLTQILSARKELQDHVAVLEKIDNEEKDPTRKKWRAEIERARVLEKEAEIGEAIEIYKKVPKEFQPQGLAENVEKLEKKWKPVSDAHAAARVFVYKTYPALKTADLAGRWKDVENAFEQCKKASDRYGLIKLLKTSERSRDRATAEANALKPHLNPDEEKPAKQIAEVLTKLVKLIDDANAALEGLKS
jgi:hypothetical protein